MNYLGYDDEVNPAGEPVVVPNNRYLNQEQKMHMETNYGVPMQVPLPMQAMPQYQPQQMSGIPGSSGHVQWGPSGAKAIPSSLRLQKDAIATTACPQAMMNNPCECYMNTKKNSKQILFTQAKLVL